MSFKKSQLYSTAQIALPFVLLISGIIIEIAIAGALVAYFSSSTSLGDRLALRATSVANSGIQDAIFKISQNKELGDTTYTMTIGSDSTEITITRATDSAANAYVYTITSLATASSRQKKFQAIMVINVTTGKIDLRSITDMPVS